MCICPRVYSNQAAVICECVLLTDGRVSMPMHQRHDRKTNSREKFQLPQLCGANDLLTFVHIERDRPDCDPDHALWVVEKLNGLRVQGKIISVLEAWKTESEAVNKEDSLRERAESCN